MPRDEEVHEPSDRGEAREWLAKASLDLEAAATLLRAPTPLPAVAMFTAQQAAEKSWKALLALHGEEIRTTHDLRELGRQVSAIDPGLADLAARGASLTPFAWIFRYPGESDEPTLDEAVEVVSLARSMFEAIRGRHG